MLALRDDENTSPSLTSLTTVVDWLVQVPVHDRGVLEQTTSMLCPCAVRRPLAEVVSDTVVFASSCGQQWHPTYIRESSLSESCALALARAQVTHTITE